MYHGIHFLVYKGPMDLLKHIADPTLVKLLLHVKAISRTSSHDIFSLTVHIDQGILKVVETLDYFQTLQISSPTFPL